MTATDQAVAAAVAAASVWLDIDEAVGFFVQPNQSVPLEVSISLWQSCGFYRIVSVGCSYGKRFRLVLLLWWSLLYQ
jgi:hypothetical protein